MRARSTLDWWQSKIFFVLVRKLVCCRSDSTCLFIRKQSCTRKKHQRTICLLFSGKNSAV